MNKTLYYFGIVLFALLLAAGTTQGILVIWVGGAIFTFDSFLKWFLVVCALSLASSIVLLRYYDHKGYKVTFWIGIISLLATASQQLLLYFILRGARDLQSLYITNAICVLIIGLMYAVSLMFSNASERLWLKRSGYLMIVVTIPLLILVGISISSTDMALRLSIQKAIEWISLVASLVPIFFILNFREEYRGMESESGHAPNRVKDFIGFASLLAFGLTVAFGVTLAGEGSTHLYWQTKNAEETANFAKLGEERTFTNAKGQTLKYLLVKPKDLNPETKYPLVVSLPYGGYEASAAQLLANSSNAYKYPAFLFVPFCPDGAGWGGIPNYPTIDTLVFDAIFKLEEEMNIDARRRYVTGVSRGGYGSWHFITTRPDMFAAAIPVCGGGNPQLASRIRDVSVWAFHGALDRNVPVSGSRDMIDALKKAGGDPKYTEFSDKAHNIWYEVTQTSGVWDWLFEQRKE
jgi:hypothetical protein